MLPDRPGRPTESDKHFPADLIIDVDVTRFGLDEFTRTDELAAIGAQTTELSIENIRSALGNLDRQLFGGHGDSSETNLA